MENCNDLTVEQKERTKLHYTVCLKSITIAIYIYINELSNSIERRRKIKYSWNQLYLSISNVSLIRNDHFYNIYNTSYYVIIEPLTSPQNF